MKRNALKIAQWAFAVLVVVFAGIAVARQWGPMKGRLANVQVEWWKLLGASLVVLAVYAVLIETWRRVLAAWDAKLDWATAAQIWFASSLGKYLPGNVWSLAALGVMAKGRGASGVAAAGSSIIVNVLNLVSGLALVVLFAARLLPHAEFFAAIAVLIVAGAVAAPKLLPSIVRLACRITKRDIQLPVIPPSTIWWSLFGTAFAWCAYGVAFRLFAEAILGPSAVHGGIVLYIAAYTAAYIVGFVTLFAPAGLGVRELGIVEGLPLLGLTSHSDAVIIAITSRLWLTVLEVIPGLIALALVHTRTRPATRTGSA